MRERAKELGVDTAVLIGTLKDERLQCGENPDLLNAGVVEQLLAACLRVDRKLRPVVEEK